MKIPCWIKRPTWLPNTLTFSRWIMAPLILSADLLGSYWWAAGFLYWAVFSDMIDGLLARKLKVAGTRFGKALDRYGDTLVVTLATAGLILTHPTPSLIGLFIFGLAWVVILEAGKRYLPEGIWLLLFTQALRLYYIAVIIVLMMLYFLTAGGPVWLLAILSVILGLIGLYVKKDRIKTF